MIEDARRKITRIWHKITHCCFAFKDTSTGHVLPTVVFKVGFMKMHDAFVSITNQQAYLNGWNQVIFSTEVQSSNLP